MLYDVAPDGRSLVLDRWGENGLGDLFVLPLEGDRRLRPVIETPFMEGWGRFSPDGRWLAYVYSEGTGGSEVLVQPFPPTGERWQVSAGGGGYPVWRADGRELFYLGGGKLLAVDVRPGSEPPGLRHAARPVRRPAHAAAHPQRLRRHRGRPAVPVRPGAGEPLAAADRRRLRLAGRTRPLNFASSVCSLRSAAAPV